MDTNTSSKEKVNEAVVSDSLPVFMLTTTDNPYNPHTQWDEWYAFDVASGYFTCAYLARIVNTSDELSEADEIAAIQAGIDEIVRLNITGRYIKVTEESFNKRNEKPSVEFK